MLRGLLEYATHICIEPFLVFSHSCVYLLTIYAVVMLVTSLLCNNFGKGYVHCPPSNVDITLHVYTFKFKREHELRPAQVNAAEAAAQLKLGEQMGMKREQERKKGCTTGTV